MSKPFKMKAAGHNNSPMQKNFPGDIKANPGDSPLEKFDWGAALSGAGKGAAVGTAVPGIGTAFGAIAGGLMAGFSSGNKQKKQEDAQILAQKTEEEKDKLILAAKEESEKEEVGYTTT